MTPFWMGLLIGMPLGAALAFLIVGLMLIQDRHTPEDDAEQARELHKWAEENESDPPRL